MLVLVGLVLVGRVRRGRGAVVDDGEVTPAPGEVGRGALAEERVVEGAVERTPPSRSAAIASTHPTSTSPTSTSTGSYRRRRWTGVDVGGTTADVGVVGGPPSVPADAGSVTSGPVVSVVPSAM
ncbi:MAG: hypothetical protein ACKOOG_10105, partial [Actinomycetota bacterium]